ncbi:hypothetical protein PYW07_017262 [Mythimna separata]|uniref:Major facilitator superfamily (MFS) profile domain-containing protein n=1 Tax=Mythimna separata TaxID=271217 RepID=A0AAD7YXN2_MYTSE|nr:hypothetical protein PYW07_017262 [Mythimna separata]
MAEGRQAQYLVAAAVSLAAIVAGFAVTWSTPVIPMFHNNETAINIADKEISWVVAMSAPGFMAGSLVARFISDGFGRRAVILSSAVPVVTGTIIILSTAIAWCLYVTRFLWGVGTGMIATVSAIYLAEVSDTEVRGSVTSSYRYMRSFGSFLIMLVGPFVSYNTINYLFLVLPVCYFIACCFVPESPYYLLKEGKFEPAKASLVRLSGNKDDKVIDSRLSAMSVDVKKETLRSGSLKELLTGKQYRKALIICIGLKIAQMMSGSIAIQEYLGRIVQESQTDVNVSTVLIIYGAVKFIVGIFSSAIVDKVGRRPLLIYSFLSSGISLIVVGAYFLILPNSSSYYSYIPFIGIIFSSMMSILGYDTIVFIILAEIFPLNVKSVAMTFQNILGGFLNFLSVKGYQEVKDVAGLAGVFWFYAAITIIGAIFSYFVVPETKGKSLREIQVELQGALYNDTDEKINSDLEKKHDTETELIELKRDYT